MDRVSEVADRIDDLLPQTQCRRCGYAGCRPYAEAIATGDADVNRCPPGGEPTLAALARLLAREAPPLDTARGTPGPLRVARIDERACIGCTLCIAACPVDAIVGGQKRMHGVLASLCTGCELCLPSCPVDCIEMVPSGRDWRTNDALAARLRFQQRERRLAKARVAKTHDAEARQRKDAIDAAFARARARRKRSITG
jgi:Na+-translocating ferredoxin:NAD+ oxidoreductase subunit B